MRILYVIQAADYSGAEILLMPLMRADPDPLLACPPGSRTEEWARANGVPTVALPFRTLRHSGGVPETLRSIPRGLRSAYDLRRVLRRHPERKIVLGTSLRPAMLAGLAAAGLDRRVVWSLTDFLPPQAPLRVAIRALAALSCSRAVALSRAIAGDFSPRSGRLRRKVAVAYPGVELESVEQPARRPGEGRIGIVGHISPTKRTDLALDVVARVPRSALRVIGRAQYRDEDFALERELRERADTDPLLRGRVEFAGYAGDVYSALRDLDVLLHCRPDEPFGMVLVEAMAAGLPVVAPASAGPLEIVEDGVTGYVYTAGDADAAARCVARLVDDPAAAARMGQAGRERVERLFSSAGHLAALRRELDIAAE